MTIKLGEAFKFQLFYSTIQKVKLPLKTAYKLSKIFSDLQNNIKFYQDSYNKIIDTYAKKDEEGNIIRDSENLIQITLENPQQCEKELVELENMEIILDDLYLSISDLEMIDLTVDQMLNIFPFIKE